MPNQSYPGTSGDQKSDPYDSRRDGSSSGLDFADGTPTPVFTPAVTPPRPSPGAARSASSGSSTSGTTGASGTSGTGGPSGTGGAGGLSGTGGAGSASRPNAPRASGAGATTLHETSSSHAFDDEKQRTSSPGAGRSSSSPSSASSASSPSSSRSASSPSSSRSSSSSDSSSDDSLPFDLSDLQDRASKAARGAYDKAASFVRANPRAAAGIGVGLAALFLHRATRR
jgi:hypothetical protein